jgi:hypothetical protein
MHHVRRSLKDLRGQLRRRVAEPLRPPLKARRPRECRPYRKALPRTPSPASGNSICPPLLSHSSVVGCAWVTGAKASKDPTDFVSVESTLARFGSGLGAAGPVPHFTSSRMSACDGNGHVLATTVRTSLQLLRSGGSLAALRQPRSASTRSLPRFTTGSFMPQLRE